MKYIFCLILLIQIQKCKPENVSTTPVAEKEVLKNQKVLADHYMINSIEKTFVGKEILDAKKIAELKNTYKTSLSRQMERPQMWDVFVSSNSDLLQFFDYRVFSINEFKIKSYYFKINNEDGTYEGVLLLSENSLNENNSMIVFEDLKSEENYKRTTEVNGDILKINFEKTDPAKNLTYEMKDGVFLDYFDKEIIDEKWGKKGLNEVFEYEIKGMAKNHLKDGYWIEKKYSVEYGKNIIEDGNYKDGIRNGEWNYSVDGPVDQIKTYEKGIVVKSVLR